MTNRRYFTDLSDLVCLWRVDVDGRPVQKGRLGRLRIPPQQSCEVRIPLSRRPLPPGGEAFLTVRFVTARETGLLPKGHEVAWEQFPLPWESPPRRRVRLRRYPAPTMDRTGSQVSVTGEGFRIEFDADRGLLTRWVVHGSDLMMRGPVVNLWRAPTDNDGIKLAPERRWQLLNRWLEVGLDRLRSTCTETDVRAVGLRRVRLTFRGSLSGADDRPVCAWRLRYDVLASGDVLCDVLVDCARDLPQLPRIGIVMVIPATFEWFEWYGRGPHENYIDRCEGARLGRFRARVADLYVPYIMPQENGNRTGVRWAALHNGAGEGLFAQTSGDPLEMTATHYPAEDLFRARHTNELHPRPEVFWYIDARQRGLGGASCGPDTLPQYRVLPGRRRFGFRLRPLAGRSPIAAAREEVT